jgi:SAM-dependent methyltransferase
MSASREQFARIYRDHLWDGASRSGPGSDPQLLSPYLNLLAELMRKLGVRSVLDVGCGDWSLAGTMDWSGVRYTGMEIVPALVDRLNHQHGSSAVRFVCADAVGDALPNADLCVAKDVLQHLSNASVQKFLSKLDGHFRYALITNDMTHEERAGWRRGWKGTHLPPNSDIPDGGYRPLRLTEKPFGLRAARLAVVPLRFPRNVMGTAGTVYETKEVLFWERSPAD